MRHTVFPLEVSAMSSISSNYGRLLSNTLLWTFSTMVALGDRALQYVPVQPRRSTG